MEINEKEFTTAELWNRYCLSCESWNQAREFSPVADQQKHYEELEYWHDRHDRQNKKDIAAARCAALLCLMSDHELNILAQLEDIDPTDVIALEEFRDAYRECMAAEAVD